MRRSWRVEKRLTKVRLYPWHHLRVYPCSSVTVSMRDCSSRRSYKFDTYQLTNDKGRDRKNVQHPLVNRVIPDNKSSRQIRESQENGTYSLFLDITIRIPPRATSRNRIWNPLKSFPTFHISEVSRRKQLDLGRKHTDYDKHSERLPWVLNLWQEIWGKAKGESYFCRLVEIGF